MSKTILICVLICLFSLASAGIFNFGFRSDTDIYIRESKSTRCQWYNSGILGLIPRRVNSTTYCHCRAIGMYECATFTSRAAPTTLPPSSNSTTPSPPTVSGNATNTNSSSNSSSTTS